MDSSPSTASTASFSIDARIVNLRDVPTHQILMELKRRYGRTVKKDNTTTGKRVILIGAPGSGKGTQSACLKHHLGLAHLSTGDMLREAVAAKTELGQLVR